MEPTIIIVIVGSINPDSYATKKDIILIFEKYNIPFREGRVNNKNPADGGDSLDDLKQKLKQWLRIHAREYDLLVNKMNIELLCEKAGHFSPLWTPPYHPELHPIELLWRDVKQHVARKYAGGRSMSELEEQVKEGFLLYGTAEWASTKLVPKCLEWENRYKIKGFNGDGIPPSWDDYIIENENRLYEDLDEGINDDIEEEDGDDEDGFAMAEI